MLENYINLQPIGDAALSYRPRAGGGNTLAVARALDAGPYPELYTDMDAIYNSLDLINIGDGSTLRKALTQLGGEPYADIPTVETQAARMFLDAVHDEVSKKLRGGLIVNEAQGAAVATGGPADRGGKLLAPRLCIHRRNCPTNFA